MSVLMVTYDLKAPGRNYTPVHDYLKTFAFCKGMESFWLIDTTLPVAAIRDDLMQLVDGNDELFVAELTGTWASYNYYCAEWLQSEARTW